MIFQLQLGDCVELMQELPSCSIGAVVCDPPYGLKYIGKDWDDLTNIQPWHEAWLTEALRILQPGGLLKAFAATRTFHRLARAMQQVGFQEIALEAWVYPPGFPKSVTISKILDAELTLGRSDTKSVAENEKTRPVVGSVRRVVSSNRVKGQEGWHGGPAYKLRWNEHSQGVIAVTGSQTAEAKKYDGYGTALKPAWEPFVVGRKPR